VEEFSQGYPRRTDLVGLMGRLTKLAQSLSLQVPDVNYTPSEMKEVSLTKVVVTMGVEGTYGKIRRYLYELEGMRRFLVIEGCPSGIPIQRERRTCRCSSSWRFTCR